MKWPSILFALFKILPAIFQCLGKVPLDIAIRHTHHKYSTPVCGLCWYIVIMSIRMGKAGSCQHAKSLIEAPVFWFHFVKYGFENGFINTVLFRFFTRVRMLFPFHQHSSIPPNSYFLPQPSSPYCLCCMQQPCVWKFPRAQIV